MREYSHIKPDEIAAPIDIRLLPATILTITVCLLLPQLPDSWGTYLPWALPLLGGTIIVALWFVRSARKRRIFNFLLLIASACWLATPAAFVVQHQQIAAQKAVGWSLQKRLEPQEYRAILSPARLSAQADSDQAGLPLWR